MCCGVKCDLFSDNMGRKRPKKHRRRSSSSSSSDEESQRKIRKLQKQITKLKDQVSSNLRPVASVSTTVNETIIPVFDPSAENLTIIEWTQKVDELSDYHKWDEDTTLKLATSRLRGNARKWYDTVQVIHLSWDILKDLLITNFPGTIKFGKLLVEAALCAPHPKQNLGDYCFEKVAKLNKLHLQIPDIYLIDSVIEGIVDTNVALAARAAKFQSVGELANYLSSVGSQTNIKGSEKMTTKDSFTVRKGQFSSGSSYNVKREQQKKNINCYNCGGNHYANQCRKPKLKCTLCGKLGHVREQCTRDSRSAKDKAIVAACDRPTKPESLFIKTARINGHKMKCLIDTGSTCTLLRYSIAKMLNMDIVDGKPKLLRSFNGLILSTTNSAKINITVEGVNATVIVLILDDDRLSHELIIGTDFINQEHVIMLKTKGTVRLRTLEPLKADEFNYCNVCDVEQDSITIETLKIGDQVKDTQKLQIVTLLNEYRDCVSFSLRDLGKTNGTQMSLKLKCDEPVVYNPYRMSVAEKDTLRGIVKELLENEIIRESTSPYASPVLLVKKKTGDYRMVVDYRRLNAKLVKEKYPLPLIDDQIDRLGGNKYFITLDMASGFYQIPMAKDSVDKTAFITPEGHFEFLRMPFGLANSPAVFQRLVNNVLGDLRNEIAYPYIDDIIIPARTVEEGLGRLEKVLEVFRKNNLTLKLSKCEFFKTNIDYLGREISKEGVRPGTKKVDALVRMASPQNVKQVRQFLGLAGYFRKFVPNYAKIVEPLTRLTRKNIKWEWLPEQEEVVKKIKTALASRPILAIFDPNLPTELHTDASASGVAGLLLQRSNGDKKAIGYFSKQTTYEQKIYHSYELETMAVVMSLRFFRVYLVGLQFKVVTDCNALRTTFTKKDLIPRIGRWWLEIQDYDFQIEYRPGKRMAHVDALSRNPVMEEINVIDLTESEWVIVAQMQDEEISRIKRILERKQICSDSRQYFKDYLLRDGKVYRRLQKGRTAWLVPKSARLQICKLCHDDAGHLGLEKTLDRVADSYWFPQMRKFVAKYIKACLNCLYYKHPSGKRQGELHPVEKVPVPFHTLHLDHLGPFECSKKKNQYILVVVDGFTKFIFLEPVKSTKVRHVTKTLMNIMYLFGTPVRIITDRGSAFTSKTFAKFCSTYGIRHILNAVATPRANGQCERVNRTVLNCLATTAGGESEKLWDTYVKQIQSILNCTKNKTTKVSPLEVLAGYKGRTIAESKILSDIKDSLDRIDLRRLRSDISKRITDEQKAQKKRFDRTRAKARIYKEGEVVMVLRTDNPATGKSRKLLPKFKGPFRIRRVLYNDRYEVEDLREGFRKYKTVVAVDKIKPFIMLKD